MAFNLFYPQKKLRFYKLFGLKWVKFCSTRMFYRSFYSTVTTRVYMANLRPIVCKAMIPGVFLQHHALFENGTSRRPRHRPVRGGSSAPPFFSLRVHIHAPL